MGPPDHGKATSMFSDGLSKFLLRMFPTALNGLTGSCKASIDVLGWGQ
jgi:hypothetical protein